MVITPAPSSFCVTLGHGWLVSVANSLAENNPDVLENWMGKRLNSPVLMMMLKDFSQVVECVFFKLNITQMPNIKSRWMWPGGDVPPPCCVNPEESSQIQRCLEHGLEITKVQDSEREGKPNHLWLISIAVSFSGYSFVPMMTCLWTHASGILFRARDGGNL